MIFVFVLEYFFVSFRNKPSAAPCHYKSVVSKQVMATHKAHRVEVPKPYVFNGKRDAKEARQLFVTHGVVF